MKVTSSMVLFWGTRDIFSNWHPAEFVVNGNVYQNAEQFMMAAKARHFEDAATEAKILAEPRPAQVKALGRQVRGYVDAEWVEHREELVFQGCLAKFSQNIKLRAGLQATGDKLLVEASPVDRIWGIGLAEADPRCLDETQWQGLNLLGVVLMKVRDALKPIPSSSFATAQLF